MYVITIHQRYRQTVTDGPVDDIPEQYRALRSITL